MTLTRKTFKKLITTAFAAFFVLTVGTFSFGQTSFGDIWTTAVTQTFYQLLMPTTASSGEQTTANDQTVVQAEKQSLDDIVQAPAAAFTAGNLVVSRIGDGTTALSSAASPLSLVEFSTAGVSANNTIALPSFSTGGNNQGGVTDSGTATSNGFLNRSSDGQFLSLIGIDAQLGTASVTGTSSTTANRNVANINSAGSVSIKARLTDAFTTNNARAAVSTDGNNFWVAGTGTAPSDGVRYVNATTGTPTTSTQIAAGNLRNSAIFGGVLFTSTTTAISSYNAPNAPPTTATTGSPITFTTGGITAGSGAFFFFDRDAATGATNLNGLDTLYLVDGSAIEKYEWTGAGWTQRGSATFSGTLFGLTAAINGNNVDLYTTTNLASNNALLKATDTTGFGGTLNQVAANFTSLATAGTNFGFRSVAFAPGVAGNTAPAFTSATSATFTQNAASSFTVSASGTPTPTISLTSGTLPNGVTFTANANGTATLAGTPTQSGTFNLVFTATNSVSSTTQNFTLTVNAAANPTVNLSIAPATGTEAAQTTFTATATASAAQATAQSVNFALTSGTATAADFTTIAGTITIPANSTTGTTTFSVVDDTLVEGTENATFTISNPSAGITLGTTTTATVSITDNDVAAASDLTITQNAPTSVPVNGAFTYTLVVTNTGAALSGTAFDATFVLPVSGYTNATVATRGCFASSSISGTTVTFTGCTTLAANATSTLTVNITPTATGTLTSGTATVDSGNTITETNEANNTAAGVSTTVNAAVTGIVINELYTAGGNSGAIYNADYVELYNNGTTTQDLSGYSIQYFAAAGTNAASSTFSFASGTTIAPGAYYLIQGSTGTAGGPIPATVDATSTLALGAAAGNVLFVAGTTVLPSCTSATGANVIDKVGYGTTAGCFEGTAAAPAPTTTQTIQRIPNGVDNNQNSTDFRVLAPTPRAMNVGPTITVNPTSLNFGNQTVNTASTPQSYTLTGSNLSGDVTVTAPTGYAVSTTQGGPYTATLTVTPTSGSVNATIYVQFTPTSTTTFTGNITNASTGATTQNVAVSGTGVAANAAPTITATPTAQTINSGGTGTSTIAITDEDAASVTLAGTSDNQTLVPNANIVFTGTGASRTLTVTPVAGQSGTAVITVTATDAGNLTGTTTYTLTVIAQPGTIAFSAADYAVTEGTNLVTVTVNRTGGTDGAVSVDYATSDGTAINGACNSAGADYQAVTGTLNFAAGASSATFTVSICDDAIYENTELFNLTLSAPTGGASLGTQSTATVTIADNDPIPTFSISDVSANEGDSGATTFTFTVSKNGASAVTATVDYATANDTAIAGEDYTTATGTLTFAAGIGSQPVTVTVNGDTTNEPNETFFVNLANATNATISDAQAVGTIINDEVSLTTLDAPNCTGIAPTPLNAGSTNKALLCIALSSNSNANFTALNVPFTNDPSVRFSNPRLISSVDASYTTTGDNTTVATGTVDTTQFTFANFNAFAKKGKGELPSLTATPLNFFIVADVLGTVNTMTPGTQPSVAPANVTVSNGTVTGTTATGQNYTFTLAPTAASAEISGRVTNRQGRGLLNVRVTLSGGSLSEPVTVNTNTVGRYVLRDIPVGETYVITVWAKSHTFSEPSAVYTVNANLSDVNFVSDNR